MKKALKPVAANRPIAPNSATVNSADTYNGGSGVDTLRLVLTRAEWMSEALQSDIANYLVFMAANTEADGQATNAQFAFSAFGLTVAKIEKLQVSVDGVSIDPANRRALELQKILRVLG